MRAWMDDTVEVEIEIVHLFSVGVGLSGVDGILNAIDDIALLDDTIDNLGILLGKPSEERWNTHDDYDAESGELYRKGEVTTTACSQVRVDLESYSLTLGTPEVKSLVRQKE